MKRFFVFLLSVILITVSVFSQKVVRFTNVDKDSVRVQSMQGINLNIEKNFESHFPFYFGIWGRIGYFNEFSIGKISTLTFSGDISINRTIKNFENTFNQDNIIINQHITYGAGIYAGLSADYRLYLFYINRVLKGKNSKLNSGIFLSLPASLTTSDLIPVKDSPFDTGIRLTPYLSPGIGYRYAFSDHFFIEGKAGFSIYGLELGEFYMTPNINLRASFTF